MERKDAFGLAMPQVDSLRARMAEARGVTLESNQRVAHPYLPPDGLQRSAEEERQINEAFAALFDDSSIANTVLDYLRAISVFNVPGPGGADHGQLAHHAGQCFHQAIIETRIEHGRNRLPEI